MGRVVGEIVEVGDLRVDGCGAAGAHVGDGDVVLGCVVLYVEFHLFVHDFYGLNDLVDVELAARTAEVAFALLDVFADFFPFVLVPSNAVGQAGALEIGQEASNDGVDCSKGSDADLNSGRWSVYNSRR